jgi:type IV secretion system protein VirD4
MTRKQTVTSVAVAAYLILAFFGIQYLAGIVFFLANKALPHHVTVGTWSACWHLYAADPVQHKRLQGSIGFAALAVLGIPLLIVAATRKQDPASLHGSARFATTGEVQKDGLFAQGGVIVGKMERSYITVPGTAPLLIAAPTRQGKGAGIVIPNLLHYADSVVVLDIKLENFQLTSLFRQKHGQKVFLFNPFAEDGRTHRWNPLDSIRRGRDMQVVDAMAIGEMLYPRTTDENAMWNDLARDLFMAFALYLLETPELPCTFGEILRQASGQGRGIKEHVEGIMAERHSGPRALSDPCFQAFGRFCSAHERTLSSIVTTMTAPLLVFSNAYVDAATSATDFDVSRVRKERMTIYVGIPANMMASAAAIVNLFFSHLINQNMKELPEQNAELKYQCLVLLDELTTLGRVGIIAKSIGQISGYNLRLMPVIQGISQLISVYGEHDARTIETNCAVQVLYPPREQKDAAEYSEMLGAYTTKSVSTGISAPRRWGNNATTSETVSEQRRALLLPQELREMPWTREIIIKAGIKPILCDKALYFADPVFMDRLKALSPTLRSVRGLPDEKLLKRVALTRGELSIQLPQLKVQIHRTKTDRYIRPETGAGRAAPRLVVDAAALPPLDSQESESSVSRFVEELFKKMGDGQAKVSPPRTPSDEEHWYGPV